MSFRQKLCWLPIMIIKMFTLIETFIITTKEFFVEFCVCVCVELKSHIIWYQHKLHIFCNKIYSSFNSWNYNSLVYGIFLFRYQEPRSLINSKLQHFQIFPVNCRNYGFNKKLGDSSSMTLSKLENSLVMFKVIFFVFQQVWI